MIVQSGGAHGARVPRVGDHSGRSLSLVGLTKQLLQPGGHLPVPAGRDQVHPLEATRVTEPDDLVARCLYTCEAVSSHPLAQVSGDVDVGYYRRHPLGVGFAGQDHHSSEDRDLDWVSIAPPQQRVNGKADLGEQEVSGLFPRRQRAQRGGGTNPELCHPGEGWVCDRNAWPGRRPPAHSSRWARLIASCTSTPVTRTAAPRPSGCRPSTPRRRA
jgi:hypothetical protein